MYIYKILYLFQRLLNVLWNGRLLLVAHPVLSALREIGLDRGRPVRLLEHHLQLDVGERFAWKKWFYHGCTFIDYY